MNKPRMVYFEREDIVHLTIAEGPEARSVELSPNITVELNDQGQLIGIEILGASKEIGGQHLPYGTDTSAGSGEV